MKYIYKLTLIVAMAFIVLPGCDEVTDLDINTNPNAVSPDQAGVDFLYNNVQLTFRNLFNGFHFISDGLVRHVTQTNPTYANALNAQTGNGVWNTAYAGLFPDIDALLALAEERGLDVHAGSAKIMKAYALMWLTDFFVDVPMTEAGQGAELIAPRADEGSTVYAGAQALLDEAIGQLSGTNAASPAEDNFYGGNAASWITLANTMKLKIAFTTNDVAGMSAIINGGDFIDDAAEDFQFNYGNNRLNPNSRHPFYNNSYEAGDGTYQSNYFMWMLCCEKEIEDPRARFYFYRQTGNSFSADPNAYSCIFTEDPTQEGQIEETYPAHYRALDPNLPYCVGSSNGYYGRDHLNGTGIPPDGPIRTVYGLYPGGGRWDGNTFAFTQNLGVDGALGQGINPILMSSFVDLMRATAAVQSNTGEDARALLESGVRKSINKVLSFQGLASTDIGDTVIDPITGDEITRGSIYLPTAGDVDEYVATVLAAFDEASDKLDVIGKEFMIATYGSSAEMYNYYRKTGKPANMQPGIDNQAIDAYPRSILLPADHVNLNQNAVQKTLAENVFWDAGSSTVR